MTANENASSIESKHRRRESGVWHAIIDVLLSPARAWNCLAETRSSGAALPIFLVIQALFSAAVVSTGIPDYEIDLAMQAERGKIIREFEGDENSERLATSIDLIDKQAVFSKLFGKIALIAGGPIKTIVSVCFFAGALFAFVALGGNKPHFGVIAGIVILSYYVLLPRMGLELYLITQMEATRVDLSLAAFVTNSSAGLPAYLALRRLDPFEFWFWGLVGHGLVTTGQMSVKAAIISVVFLALVAAAWNVAVDLPVFAIYDIPMALG